MGGRCSIGMLMQASESNEIQAQQACKTHPLPSAMSRSTVLTGATTMKGMLWRAAKTAALYVPICQRTF